MDVVYTIEQLRERISPVADKYRLRAVYLFGSYAKGKATEQSDVDILVDRTDSIVKGWIIGGLYNDLCESVGKGIDMVTTHALTQDGINDHTPWFTENVMIESVQIYG